MKFLVTGANGLLGFDISKELTSRDYNHLLVRNSRDLEITNSNEVDKMIVDYKPDVIIHCAAYTNVNQAEKENQKCIDTNILGTTNIINSSRKIDAKVVYVSSDYVFDGKKDGPYEEDDISNPLNEYGKTKYLGELEVLKYDKIFIVRTSWLFGINGNNFVKKMFDLSKTKEEVYVVQEQVGSPTYTVDLAKLIIDMSLTSQYGVYHATNSGYVNRYELAKAIFKISGSTKIVKPKVASSLSSEAIGPTNSRLNNQKLASNGFRVLPNWEDALIRYMEELIIK